MIRNCTKTFVRYFAFAIIFAAVPAFGQAPVTLINANIASDYIVTSMPMTKSPGCPLIGSIRFFPGGTLSGTFVTDMPRSKAIAFTGSYTLSGGKNLKFKSNSKDVPLQNISGTIARSVVLNKRLAPIDSLVISTATPTCPGESYKLALTEDDE